jgi:uncharacterized protein
MKYLVLLMVVIAVIWFVRNHRRSTDRSDTPARPPKQAALGEPQDMVRCPVCSLHLPRVDALPGPDGQMYCCAEHRARVKD